MWCGAFGAWNIIPFHVCEWFFHYYALIILAFPDLTIVVIWTFPKIRVPPQSSILVGVSILNHLFWGTPTYWNPHIVATCLVRKGMEIRKGPKGPSQNPDGRSLTSNQRQQARWMNASLFACKMLSARRLLNWLGHFMHFGEGKTMAQVTTSPPKMSDVWNFVQH